MSNAVGPYSTWLRAGDFITLAGQIGLVPGVTPPTMVDDSAPGQLRQAITNAKTLLAEAGTDLSHVVKATLFLVDMNDFAACNDVWLEFFHEPRPTRSTIAVAALPFGARSEIELWAYSPAS